MRKTKFLTDHHPAGLFRRFAAILYDAFLVFASLMLATIPALVLSGGEPVSHCWGYKIYLFLVWFAFYTGFWVYGGQTLGMRTWKTRVVGFDGNPINWKQASIRFLTSCFGIANFWALIDKNGLGWHEYLSHTVVIRMQS